MNILGPYVFVHLHRYTSRINRKSSSCEHHWLTPRLLSLNHLALHCRRPKRIVFSSIKTLQDTWLFVAPSLLGKMMNQGDRGQTASLLALLPWTHWFFLAHLSPTDFGPDYLSRLTGPSAPSSSMACLLGCLVPVRFSPRSGTSWGLDLAPWYLLALPFTKGFSKSCSGPPASVIFVFFFL